MRKSKLGTLLLASVFTLGSTFALAETSPNTEVMTKQAPTKSPEKKKEHRAERFKSALFENVNLTEEQEAKINQINRENKEEKRASHRSNMKTMFAMHKDIKDASLSDNFSEDKINAIVDQYSAEIKKNIVEQAKVENEIYNVLTPEQKVTYKENIQKMEDQFKQRKMHRN